MRNIRLKIEYDGSRYQGWARLGKNESTNTVSNKILECLQKMTKENNPELFCGCRTEVGVHAYAQVANFKTNSKMRVADMKHYLNRYLPMDIAVTEVSEVPERFHAALNAKAKTYSYRITVSDVPSVFDRKLIYHCFHKPDAAQMEAASRLLLGRHDFKNFSTAKKAKTTVREIKNIEIYDGGEEMLITITANDFLHNMARILIGTLLDIGLGTKGVDDITDIFAGKTPAGEPCSPIGLYLQEIHYSE